MALPGLGGGDRIMVGARFLSHLDPGWWREGALLPASPTALDMADPYRCVLAWWAAQHLPAPAQQAQALGFTGVDADRLTPGWRHLITYLRASYEGGAAVDPARPPGRHLPRWAGARAGHERGLSWRRAR
jgi:hypothetical protein